MLHAFKRRNLLSILGLICVVGLAVLENSHRMS
jgi:hypothetical protein